MKIHLHRTSPSTPLTTYPTHRRNATGRGGPSMPRNCERRGRPGHYAKTCKPPSRQLVGGRGTRCRASPAHTAVAPPTPSPSASLLTRGRLRDRSKPRVRGKHAPVALSRNSLRAALDPAKRLNISLPLTSEPFTCAALGSGPRHHPVTPDLGRPPFWVLVGWPVVSALAE